MNVLISACLLGCHCKYDGGNNDSPILKELIENHNVITVCPEMLGGLSCPRIPCEIQGNRVVGKDGMDYTSFYKKGAMKALEIAKSHQVKVAFMKKNSPSCGVNFVYDGSFTHTLVPGSGIFTQLLKENDILIFEV